MRRVHIGVVFQFFNLLDEISALENVVLPGGDRGSDAQAGQESRARDLLDLLALGDKAAEGPGDRSPAASVSGWRSRGRSPTTRRCCSRTSRPARWTQKEGDEVLELFRRLHGKRPRRFCS